MNRKLAKKLIGKVAFMILLAVILIFTVFPFYYAIITSFETGSQLFTVEYWVTSLDVSNYASVLSQNSFVQSIWNSVFVAFSTVVIAMVFGLTAAYALGRVHFRRPVWRVRPAR